MKRKVWVLSRKPYTVGGEWKEILWVDGDEERARLFWSGFLHGLEEAGVLVRENTRSKLHKAMDAQAKIGEMNYLYAMRWLTKEVLGP